jgi:hypothetical protein
MAALIRDAVDRTYPGEPDRDAIWERALAAVGRVSSGRSDISIEHDRELAEAFGG